MVAAAPLLLIAVNLRPAVAGVGPVLPEIVSDLLLSPVHLAVLTAGPVFAFGISHRWPAVCGTGSACG
jgi:CP family cyanate transporter-like MFS transporter